VNNVVELQIGHVPWRYATGRVDVPGLAFSAGTPWELRSDGKRRRLAHIRPEEGPTDPSAFASFAKKKAGHALPLVVAPYIKTDLRRALERAGVSYLDFHGNVHLVTPGVFVHVRTPAEEKFVRSLGATGRRAAQVMLEERTRPWGVTELATHAKVSAGQAQTVMKVLEDNDLVYTEGRGPRKRRRIREPSRFVDWLASQEPKRAPRGQLNIALYARTPADLLRRFDRAVGPADKYAVTGSAAAAWLGAGPTSVPRTVIRIDPTLNLSDVARRARGEVTERGSNLTLWADEGLVATPFAKRERGVLVAPKVRIYIDSLSERRGQDIATEFREQVLGY